jgi:protein TonB
MVPVSALTRVNYVTPQYPRAAQRRNVTGYVDVSFTVRRDGSVADIEVIEGSPGRIFDDAATEAVAEWRFEPTIENGRSVEKRTAVRLAFNLQ